MTLLGSTRENGLRQVLASGLVGVVFVLFFAGTVWAQGTLPFSKAQLASINWSYSASVVKLVQNWQAFKGRQPYPGVQVLKSQPLKIDGGSFIGELRRINGSGTGSGTYEILIRPATGSPSQKILQTLESAARKSYGKTSKEIDLGFSNSKNATIMDLEADWKMGTTRVRLSHFGVKAMGKWLMGISALTISPLSGQKELIDLQYFKLEGQKRIIGVPGEEKNISVEPAMYLIIDRNKPRILRQDKELLAEISSDKGGVISAKWSEPDKVHKLSINSATKKFFWSVRAINKMTTGIDLWGVATRVDRLP